MTLRWYGTGYDTVTLEQIRQIPGVKGVITTLYGTKPGEEWQENEYLALKKEVEDAGLTVAGIESVNIHESIKAGTPERDQCIENYIKTLDMLGRNGVDLICYNFMPVFDWTRSDLARPRKDGSTVLAYNADIVNKLDPDEMKNSLSSASEGFILPGWEPDRMEDIKRSFKLYENVSHEQLFENLVYFLKAIMPVCGKYGINMAIHPDDPAWDVFGLPRIITNKENIVRMLDAVDDPHNGITLCTGSLGSNPANDLVDIIGTVGKRIHFAHVRNIKYNSPTDFEEAAHLSSDGSLDMYAIIKALHDAGFDGVIRPDHGRMIWGEHAMPGYGLYDRALGAAYLNGLWEAVVKSEGEKK